MRKLALSTQQRNIVFDIANTFYSVKRTVSNTSFHVDYNVHSNKVKLILGGRSCNCHLTIATAQKIVDIARQREDVVEAYVDTFWGAPCVLFKVPEATVMQRQAQRKLKRAEYAKAVE